MFPHKVRLGFYIPEDGIIHNHRRENFKSYISTLVSEVSRSVRNICLLCEALTVRLRARPPAHMTWN
jgi:hypothetical protein